MKNEQKEKLNKLVADIELAFQAAEKYANETHQSFSINWIYGLGGTYYPPPKTLYTRLEAIEELASNKYLSEDKIEALRNILSNTVNDSDTYELDWSNSSDDYEERIGWVSSSHSC